MRLKLYMVIIVFISSFVLLNTDFFVVCKQYICFACFVQTRTNSKYVARKGPYMVDC